MIPMNNKITPELNLLLTEYETLSDQGVTVFLEEKAYLQLIEYYESEEIFDRALEVTDHALRHYPFSFEFLLRKAALQFDDQQPSEALLTLEQAEALSPNQPEITLLRAEIYIFMERQDEAAIMLESLKPLANRATMADIYFVESILFESREEYERMFYALKAALEEDSSHHNALERIGLCVELSKKYKESVTLHKAILNEAPYAYQAWYNLGLAQSYLGDYEEAIEAFEYAFIIHDKFEFAYRDCAELCFELKKYHKALQCYKEAMEHFEADGDLLQQIGECYQQLQQYKDARFYFYESLRLDPMNDEVLFHIGECYASEEAWSKAIRAYKKAIRIEDTREEYHGALADAYACREEWSKAEMHYRKAISIAPEESRYWVTYSLYLLATGQGERALDILEEAEQYADSSEVIYCRVACLFAVGRRKEACYWLAEALVEDFEEHGLLFQFRPELTNDPDVSNLLSSFQW